MSLLSQFFPSGGGGDSTPTIKTNMLLVGGGSGGLPAGGAACPAIACYNHAAGGGGGGGGQVYEFTYCQLSSGSQICVTIGAGGGTSSNGSKSTICIVDNNYIVAKGGGSSPTPISCDRFLFETVDTTGYGGGRGRTGAFYWPSTTPGPGGNISCLPCGSNTCFFVPDCLLCSCLTIASVNDRIAGYFGNSGGSICPAVVSSCTYRPYPGPYPFTEASFFYSGLSGGGGGGAVLGGGNGEQGPPFVVSPTLPPSINATKAARGGNGGSGVTPVKFTPLTSSVGNGGGGGGGNFSRVYPTAAPCRPGVCYACLRGYGGSSPTGGCGGTGGNMSQPYYPQITAQPSGCPGCNATANTGGGGGGGGAGPVTQGTGGSGGSGVFIIQYPTVYPAAPAFPGACDCSPSTPGCYTYKFNGPGSITLP